MSKAFIDEVLAEYPDEVKVQILNIARKYRLDDDDPAFILMLAVGNLERLLTAHPQSLDANLMAMVSTLENERVQLSNTAARLQDDQNKNLADIRQILTEARDAVSTSADQEVKRATQLQAQKISQGIEVGIKVKLAQQLKTLIPIASSLSVIVFVSGLLLGILMGQNLGRSEGKRSKIPIREKGIEITLLKYGDRVV